MKWEDPSEVIPTSAASSGTQSSQTSISGEPIPQTTDRSGKTRDAIRTEMISIDSLIIRIDSLLNSDEPISDSDAQAIINSMNTLEERKKELSEQE
jgi:hypothetical protein